MLNNLSKLTLILNKPYGTSSRLKLINHACNPHYTRLNTRGLCVLNLDEQFHRKRHYVITRELLHSPNLHNPKNFSVLLRGMSHSGASKRVEPFILPDIGEGITEVVVKEWLVKLGASVKEFDPICEVESDKATATITSRYEGVITKVHYEVGDTALVGKPLVDLEVVAKGTAADSSQPTPTKETSNGTKPDTSSPEKGIKSGLSQTRHSAINIACLPSARQLALQRGIDLSLVKATGKRGQVITKEDISRYLEGSATSADSTVETVVHSGSGSSSSSQSETCVPMKGIRKAMFKTMTESLKIPHFNYSDEIDMTNLVDLVKELKSEGESSVSQLAMMIKMVSLALNEYPQLNASVDESGDTLVHKHYHNIGVAVDTQSGLVVPNIKNVQNLTVRQISSELSRLRELGYTQKLGLAELTGGTLTLSNIGAIGGVFGVPVLVSPEIVIGALGRTRKLPRFNSQGNVEARHIMQLVWSADHRVVDGATLCRFSNLLKRYLEQPGSAVLAMV